MMRQRQASWDESSIEALAVADRAQKHVAYLVRAAGLWIKTSGTRKRVTLRPEAIKTVSDWRLLSPVLEGVSTRWMWFLKQMKKAEVRDDKKTVNKTSGWLSQEFLRPARLVWRRGQTRNT